MKNKKTNNVEIDPGSIQLEQFIQKKQEESKALQKLLRALEAEQKKQVKKINI